ncbi:YggT family protein [Clostridium ganghwense]|uniref:YggT family protein n=2 Tax=Clostridium ganghwense TaxID=312089 RepID=A0ABT4CMT7_9CLOT|nr:YggT family protein [Clostridium ganghwense]
MILILRSAFNLLFDLLELLIIVDIVLSWIYRGRNTITETIHIFTEPFLSPGRKIQERLIPGLPVDLSPILALFIIGALRNIVSIVLRIL